MRKKIIFATQNEGKLKEIRAIFGEMDLEILSMKEAGIDIPIEETGTTFEENAIIKATAVAKAAGTLALADDSGLEIDYLNKEPGVYSARYAGEDTPSCGCEGIAADGPICLCGCGSLSRRQSLYRSRNHGGNHRLGSRGRKWFWL